ncbi:MAG TPA: aminoacetone oxidase family FAD-binding enzyme [Cyanobacteria bacterium UBA8803]|nr:aminoacetone oxidase family FAD-binding enzyme [Cyanobacteria bacterium UBA9273]HBL62994.1 aminoacetone oxidase family FAD-binding enzyme [Cyanobacteria bacterium UBA8803]
MKIVTIGGGAAGFFGAVTCATAYPHSQVTLLEASSQPLAKVRISGGGRCNVTHACFDPALLVQAYPRGSKALRGAFTRFQPKDTIAWFEARGVHLKTEADGRMFPVTDNSQTIVDCLFNAATAAGVHIRTATPVQSIVATPDSRFRIGLKNGEIIIGDRVLIATGSNPLGYRWAKALGHHIEPPVPSLFTFTIPDRRLQDLAGVSVSNACLRLPEAGSTLQEQTGPLLITHWGLSGPGVLKLSAWGARFLRDRHYHTPLSVNWLPQHSQDSLRQLLLNVKSQLPQRQITTSCPVLLPKRLWVSLVASAGIGEQQRWAELSKKSLNQLIAELTQGCYQITGKGVFKEEFVTCGGVSLKEVDFKTMESRICPGLYFAGEILDIDGITGGFNFQSAWTTAWLAGQAIGNNS